MQSSQECGLPSAFLAELEAVSDGSDGCNSMKLSVTHEVIEAIFRTYPTVRARHSQLVPDKMREEEFWKQFFQSQRFHRDLGPKNLLSSCLSEEEDGTTPLSLPHSCVCVSVCLCIIGQRGAQSATGDDILNTTDSPEEVSL